MTDSGREKEGLLAPYRALDLTNELGFLCGKILGDLGADVIKVEPPGGDPARRMGPFYKDIPHPEKSLYWFSYNNNKRGITLNLETATGQELFKGLAKTAHFVIESFPPGYMDGLGLGYQTLRQINPQLVMASITPYGQTGPYSHYRASDIELMATSGAMSLAGDPDRPPVRVTVPQSYMWTGMHAAMGCLMAHYYRAVSGKGQHVDVSGQDSLLPVLAHAPTFWDVLGENPRRAGPYLTGRSVKGARMRVFFPCQDGYLNFIVYGGPAGIKTNQQLTEWMDGRGMASEYLKTKEWNQFDIATVSQEEIDHIEAPAAKFFESITKEEFFQEVVKRDMLGYPVATAKEVMEDAQLKARGFWQKVEHPELGESITYPGAFAQLSQGRVEIRRRAPLIGEHNEEIYCQELGLSRQELVMLRQAGII
ncbi:MAG: CoA transferase [Chloroflexi bacterium]|nr:CoA transferase [Chloroflexota bacterium]